MSQSSQSETATLTSMEPMEPVSVASEAMEPDSIESSPSAAAMPESGPASSLLEVTPLDARPADAASLVDTYAEDLVDSLFQGVDQLLEGDEVAIATAIQTTLDSSPSAPAAQSAEGRDAHFNSGSIVPLVGDLDASSGDFFADAEGAIAPAPAPSRSWFGKTIDRLLLCITAGSLLGAAAFLGFSYQRQAATVPLASTTNLQGQSDAEFLNYLERSLEVISSRSAEADGAQTAVAQLPNISTLSASPPMLPPLASGPNGSSPPGQLNVIERVYVPYQTTAPVAAQPAPAPQAPAASTAAPATTANAPLPTTPHVLVGVLELGNRSAALFEIDGVSQRVYMGERIGSSGWNLVSVSNEEATIRRNGEVRTIYIGQRF